MMKVSQILRRRSKLIVLAGVLHLVVTAAVYTAGRLAIFPIIDRNGIAVTLSPDSVAVLSEANSFTEILTRSGPMAWLKTPANLHVKVYSLSLAILRPLLGANILSVEPVNLLCYISILGLTFKLGKEVFDERVGLIAGVAVAFWPSFLLHTTQLLKDQIFITLLLILVFIMTCWLTRTFSWRVGLGTGIVGSLVSYGVSLTRSGFWAALIVAIVLIGTGLLLVHQVREKRILPGNIISAGLILVAASTVLLFVPERLQQQPTVAEGLPGGIATADHPVGSPSLKMRADSVAKQLSIVRKEFWHKSQDSGSYIDVDVEFAGAVDVVRYLPRAIMIGFLAPFPNRWFAGGKRVPIAGQLVSGLETSIIYIVEILVLIGLWQSRANLSAWLLFFVTLAGVTAITLLVVNVGALYRMRYGFFVLLLILGAHGLVTLRASKIG